MGHYPLRVQSLLASSFGVDESAARDVVQSLAWSPTRIVSAIETTSLAACEMSAAKNHDVHDSVLVALARAYDADYLLTADWDFDDPCADEDGTYVNPVPVEKRENLSRIDG